MWCFSGGYAGKADGDSQGAFGMHRCHRTVSSPGPMVYIASLLRLQAPIHLHSVVHAMESDSVFQHGVIHSQFQMANRNAGHQPSHTRVVFSHQVDYYAP